MLSGCRYCIGPLRDWLMDSTCCTSKNISQSDKLGGCRGEVDIEAHCKQLVDYEVAEINSRIKASEERMTKADAFKKAWRLGFKRDFSLVDEIFHPD